MITIRPRRLRQNAALRRMVRETHVSCADLVLPLFIKAGENIRTPILSMPGHYQLSLDQLESEILEIVALNIPAVLLFGIPSEKDATGTHGFSEQGIIPAAIRKIKMLAPDLLVITDVCFCEYMDHGHCGIIKNDDVHNDETLPLIAKQAVSHAKAGADIVAPSGMMDGMIHAIRSALDEAGYENLPILSYAVKYASSFYGPFREAAEGAPKFGDRRTYQMDPANTAEALKEARLDVAQGADMLMIKPAQNYLDIVYRIKKLFPEIPLCAYQVSGEFAMIKAAAEKKWIDHDQAMQESLLSIKRAGADMIITYFAKEVARLIISHE